MQKTDIYLIDWYGPFTSKEELKKWEDNHPDVFNLYAFQAKQSTNKNKYYSGMAFKQTVGKRLKNHDHHIHDFENAKTKLLHIWIGAITNIKADEYDVRICENLITSILANKNIGVGEKNLENRTNKKPPLNDVYIISEWWKTNGEEIKKRASRSIPAIVPEVMIYYSENQTLYGVSKLKELGML